MFHQFLTAQEAQIAANSSRNCRMKSQHILISIIDPNSWPCTEPNPTSAFLTFPGPGDTQSSHRHREPNQGRRSRVQSTAPAAPQPFSQSGTSSQLLISFPGKFIPGQTNYFWVSKGIWSNPRASQPSHHPSHQSLQL